MANRTKAWIDEITAISYVSIDCRTHRQFSVPIQWRELYLQSSYMRITHMHETSLSQPCFFSIGMAKFQIAIQDAFTQMKSLAVFEYFYVIDAEPLAITCLKSQVQPVWQIHQLFPLDTDAVSGELSRVV